MTKSDLRQFRRGGGYALPRRAWRVLQRRLAGLPTRLVQAMIRLANVVGQFHTWNSDPEKAGRDFCLARAGKKVEGKWTAGILARPEMEGVTEHYLRLAVEELRRIGFLTRIAHAPKAIKTRRKSAHCPSGIRRPPTIYRLGAAFRALLLPGAKQRHRSDGAKPILQYVASSQNLAEKEGAPAPQVHTGDGQLSLPRGPMDDFLDRINAEVAADGGRYARA